MQERVSEIIKEEIEALKNIPLLNNFEKAIDIIYNKVHQEGGKIVTTGMGKAGQIALNIATTFSSTGSPAVFLHPSDAQHGDLGVLQKNDVLILISNSGKTREISELLFLSKKFYKNIPTILITGNPNPEKTFKTDVTLYTGNPKEVCPLGLSPTTSTTVMTVIGDVLIVLMMEKINFTKELYALRHHGGYLGEKSKRK